MGDEESGPDKALARMAREDLGALGAVDYGSAFAALARGRRRIRVPVGMAAALALGLGLGLLLGLLLGPGALAASAWIAPQRDASPASLGEEMELFLDELLAPESTEVYAFLVGWE